MNRLSQPASSGARTVALCYVRKSVVRTKTDEVSPARQADLCTDAARAHGWTAELFKDAEGHRSGGSEKNRPEWLRLKMQLRRADVAAVVVTDISRAGRSRRDLFNFLAEIEQRGIQLVDLKYQFDTTTAAGRLMLGMLINVLAWEREVDSERSIEAIAFKRARGKHVGLAPFGTKRDDKGLLVESEDWPTCRKLLETYARGELGYRALGHELNAQGLRFRNRERQMVPFDQDAVRSVVNNTLVYVGYVLNHKGRHVDVRITVDEGADLLEALAVNARAVKGQHASLISRELATRILSVRRHSFRQHGDVERRVYLLVPILYCAECGKPLRGIRMHGIARYYHGSQTCMRRSKRIDAEDLERKVLESLREMRLPAEKRDELRRRIEDRLAAVPEQAEVIGSIRNLEQKRDRLKELFVEGDIDRGQYDTQKRGISDMITALQGKLGPASFDLDGVLEQLDNLADMIAQGTPLQQRRALADIFERISVDVGGRNVTMTARPWVRFVFREFAGGRVSEAVA